MASVMPDLSPTQEGTIPFPLSSVPTPCHTYYKIFGDLHSGHTPVIVLHGGPGSGHEYCLKFRHLWSLYGIPVLLYDQIGCPASTHLRDADQSFWQPDLFIAELENLVDHFHLRDGPGLHIIGHSWGGVVGSLFASYQPRGLRRLVLAGTPADKEIFYTDLWELKKQISVQAQQAIDDAVQKRDFTSTAYLAAQTEFMKTFLCRAPDPWPPEDLGIDFKNQQDDFTVRMAMQGQSPWVADGNQRTQSCIPYLHRISASTIVINGEFDTAQYKSTAPFAELIPNVQWITLPSASHMPHLDSPEMLSKYLTLIGDFLQSGTTQR